MEEFRKDARNVKLRIGDHFIEDVTDVLKRFFREVDDPIFMADLHPLWQAAASKSTALKTKTSGDELARCDVDPEPPAKLCPAFRNPSAASEVGPLQRDHPQSSSSQQDHSGCSHQSPVQVSSH